MSELLLVGEASPPSAHDPQWPALLRAPSPEAQPVAVLIVEDEQIVALDLQQMLKSMGYDTFGIAASGEQALALTEKRSPDAVLMDITMPEMDGLTALREIRAHDPQARVAMVTALGQQQIVLAAVKSGARDFLVKPCEGDRVLAAVSKLCA